MPPGCYSCHRLWASNSDRIGITVSFCRCWKGPAYKVLDGNLDVLSQFSVSYWKMSSVTKLNIVPTGVLGWEQHHVPSSSILLWFRSTMETIFIAWKKKYNSKDRYFK